jgi:DNA-directed RNA polymerase specialized sigma24 family protein
VHIDEPETYARLARLIHTRTKDPALREDLMQEALLHLWLTENENPGHTLSWYVQSCRFHIGHLLQSGRSLDSPKRRHLGCQITNDPDQDSPLDHVLRFDANTHEYVSAQDLLAQLSATLTPRNRLILHHLTYGCGIREIARKLALTHPAVLKRVNKIAFEATQLGLARAA